VKSARWRKYSAVSSALLAACAGVRIAAAQSYSITDLGTLSGGTNSQAYGINASGEIVGYSESISGGDDLNLDDIAFRYSSGTMNSLGTFSGGGNSYATALNTGGTIAGWAYNSSGYANAFIYANGALANIGTLGGPESYAAGINDSGTVVGVSLNSNNDDHAFAYANGTMKDLGTLTGDIDSNAFAINSGGTIVGASYNSSGVAHAFSYSNGTMVDLGVPTGDTDSTAYAINDSGQIVGEAGTSGGEAHAFLYSGGTMTDLGVPAGEQNSYANAINASGIIVGTADDADGNYIAFIYEDQTMTNLNGLISPSSGWTLESAEGINAAGDIVGYGLINGNENAFLLTPTVNSQTAVWGLTGGGSWNTAANWTGDFVPSGTGVTAILGSSITGPATITLDGNQEVAALVFNSTNSYTISSGTGGTLIFSSATGDATVSLPLGSHLISAPISLAGTTTFAITNSTNSLQLSNVISGTGSLVDTGAGTLLLTAANVYTGPTTISSAAVVQVDTGANTGSISPSSAITDNGLLVFARTDNQTLTNSLSGSGILQQNGTGTITLTNAGNYSGGFTINSGAIVLNSGLSGTAGPVVLGTPQNPSGPAATTSLGNLTVSTSVIFSSLSSASDNSTADLLTIPSGVAVTDTGSFTVGAVNDTTNATVFNGALTAAGGGQLVADGTVTVGQPSNNTGGKDTTTVNLSGLNAFTVNTSSGTLNVGYGANTKGLLTLANTTVNSAVPMNSISAAEVNVGNSDGGNDPGTSFLVLGSGVNTIDSGTIFIGDGKTSGSVVFASSSSGSIAIAGTGGTGVANITIAEANGGTEGGNSSGLILAGHSAAVAAGTVIVGWEDGNSGGKASGSITFDTGNFSIQNLELAVDSSGSSTAGAAGSFTLGASAASTGTLSVGTSFILASNTNSTSGPAVGSFVINGGTANIDCNIAVTSTSGTTTSTFVLANGTLNMKGFAIGGGGAVNSGNDPITTVTLPAAGHTATLMNLGGAGINGAGLTMNGLGTLILNGTNTYSGTTAAHSGELLIADSSALSGGAVSVSAGAKMQLAPSITGSASSLTINTGGTLDLTSSNFLVNYGTAADPVATIFSYLQTGFNGNWSGSGIVSSAVASLNSSQSALIYSIGYADGADGLTSVSSGQIEIMPTLAGDARLQGDVVFGDFQLLSQYFGQSGGWDEGNFTYGSTINFGDFQLLSQNFGASDSALTSGEIASINGFAAQFGQTLAPDSGGGYSLVSVPEPATMGLLSVAGFWLLARKRRAMG
jgi:probable HAF family extracellular repeat protein/autotransporter-associated beta strand protein